MAYKNKIIPYERNIYTVTDIDGRKRYTVRVKDRFDRWYLQQTFNSLVEARVYRNKLTHSRDSGDLAISMPIEKTPTFSEFWQQWSIEYRSEISKGWQISQNQMARDHLLPYLGKIKLNAIKSRDIGQLMRTLKEKGLGDQTRLHVFKLLSSMFRDAADKDEYGLLQESPITKKHRPTVQTKEGLVLTPEESLRLLNASRADQNGSVIWLALLAGLRVEAIHALRWNAVDFTKKQILIKEAYKRKEKCIQPYPKGKKWEYVPLVPVLAEYLLELKHSRHAFDASFVAVGSDGKMLAYEALYNAVRRLCKLTQVTIVSPHRLRHSYTELCMQYGEANIEDVRRLLHHKSASTTQRYIHGGDVRLRKVADQMSEKISANL